MNLKQRLSDIAITEPMMTTWIRRMLSLKSFASILFRFIHKSSRSRHWSSRFTNYDNQLN